MTPFSPSRSLWLLVAALVLASLSFLSIGRVSRSGWYPTHLSQYDETDSFKDILNATLGFEKIFVINLPSRTDHRDSMTLSAHFTGLHVEFIDGVSKVAAKTLPPHDEGISQPALGAWRAHMDVMQRIVEQRISSALILEDDVDWDLRLKSSMQKFAKASRLLVQPRAGTLDQYLDPTNPRVSLEDQQPEDIPLSESVAETTDCPYGALDRWDLLWLGHCGTRFPEPTNPTIPLARVAYEDETVPETQHIGIQVGNDELQAQYPNHTRVVHRSAFSVCSLAYAVSLPGARRILYELGIKQLSSAMDLSLNSLCEGIEGRKMRKCLSVQPELFQHHRAAGDKGAESDIVEHEGYNPTAYTRNIRLSTRINLPKLVEGETDYIETYPDGAEPAGFGYR